MRIALFTECYRPIVNGVVVSVSTFASELRKLGHEVHIIAPAFPGYDETDAFVHRLPSVCVSARPRYPIALPYSSYRLRPLFRDRPPDVIHAQHPFTCCREGRRWARRLPCPLVFTYHTLIRSYAHYVPLPRVLVRAAAVSISRSFSNSADQVVVPTQGVADLLRSYGVRRPIEVIPTGIDLDLIGSSERQPARARLGIPDAVPLIVCSGRIAMEKGLDTLVRALALLARGGSRAHLALVGGGPWEQECLRVARAEGVAERVHITGYVEREHVFDWVSEADVFAFSSLTDTQGVAVLEAMALGRPAVAVRSKAVDDVVQDGVDGLVVDPTAEALAEGLGRLLADSDLRERLAGQARQRAEEFSAGRMTEKLVRVYERALAGQTPGSAGR